MAQNSIHIKNKKAYFDFYVIETFEAGMVLQGTEIKSIRKGKASISEAYCAIRNGELCIRNMNIAEYAFGTYNNHEPKRERKLLLKSRELKKLDKKTKESGHTIIPLHLFISESGYAKIEIGLCKGKKLYDKRDTLKDNDNRREMERKDTYRY
ncbi:MAG: SsrA-binding protein SmpB [Bacteroidales bacterium]|nr:SsrA-binding protein SmpB [Bacteroidales bacterium]